MGGTQDLHAVSLLEPQALLEPSSCSSSRQAGWWGPDWGSRLGPSRTLPCLAMATVGGWWAAARAWSRPQQNGARAEGLCRAPNAPPGTTLAAANAAVG